MALDVDQVRRSALLFPLASATCLLVAACLFLYHIGVAPDALQDESTYWAISHNVATSGHVALDGEPFFFHPPLFFWIEGLVLKVVGGPHDLLNGALAIRWFCAVIGIATAGALLLAGSRSVGRLAAVFATSLYITDPFVMRTVRRNMLEAPAMLPVVLAIWLLAGVRPGMYRRPALAGVCIGLALLTKEYTSFMLPLLAALWIWPQVLRRFRTDAPHGLSFRQTLLTGVIGVGIWSIHPLSALFSGDWVYFARTKGPGVSRFLGFLHDTGLKQHGTHHGLVSAISANLSQYASSYVILLLGAVAGVWLCLRGRTYGLMLTGLWTIVGMLYTVFETFVGIAEEQFYYYALIPAVLSLATVTIALVRAAPRVHGRALLAGLLGIVGLFSLLGYNSVVWARYDGTRDDAVLQMRHYLDSHLAHHTLILGSTFQDPDFYPNFTFSFTRSAHQIEHLKVRYALLSTKDVYIGYKSMQPAYARFLRAHGKVVFSAYSTTYWKLQLIRLAPITTSRRRAAQASTMTVTHTSPAHAPAARTWKATSW